MEQNRMRIIIWVASICAFVLLVGGLSIREQEKRIQEDYQDALLYLDAKDYAAAADCLKKVAGHADADVLYSYVRAVQTFDPNDPGTYAYASYYCLDIPSLYSGQYAEQALSLKKEIETAYENDKAAKQAERWARLSTSEPYDGMAEADIHHTKFGTATIELCRDYHYLRTERRYKIATWYDASGKKLASAYISGEGKLYGVWIRQEPTYTPKPAKKPKPTPKQDPYNSSDYSHPEDFYYDYYDDFWDYEDAEDYWNEHN